MKEREAIEELKSLRPSKEAVETVLKALNRAKKREDADYMSIYLTGIYDRDSVWEKRIDKEIEELRNMQVGGEVFTTAKNFAIKMLEELKEKKCNDIPS